MNAIRNMVLFSSASSSASSSSSGHRRTTSFAVSMMEDNVECAERVMTKWNVEAAISLFAGDDRTEAKEFIGVVGGLQSAMRLFMSADRKTASSRLLRHAQGLMTVAMKRLEKEFYQILSDNLRFTESVSFQASTSNGVSDLDDDEVPECGPHIPDAGNFYSDTDRVCGTALADLKDIADCMIASGYSRECSNIYKIVRKSIVDESLYNLGVEVLTLSQVQKMEWDDVELRIKHWLNAEKVAVKSLFNSERVICDYVFSSSNVIKESCFAEITKEAAVLLFGFPELVAKCKASPEKIFRILDLYESVSDHWPEIESIFSFESTSAVRSQAVTSLLKLGEAVRTMLSNFEDAIQKDSSKSLVPGGEVHPLTRYVMNYIIFLTDYAGSLSDIVADWPLPSPMPLPESYYSSPSSDDGNTSSALSIRLAWLILILLCKLDGKAKLYRDVSLSYLFLANNLNYVVSKVRDLNLKLLLGNNWLTKHEAKVKTYAANYERIAWGKVLAALTAEIPPETATECFRRFNSAFEEAYRKQSPSVISDRMLRDEIKVSLARKLVSGYRIMHEVGRAMLRKHPGSESVVKYTPDDLGNYLSDLFHGGNIVGSTNTSSYSRFRR